MTPSTCPWYGPDAIFRTAIDELPATDCQGKCLVTRMKHLYLNVDLWQ